MNGSSESTKKFESVKKQRYFPRDVQVGWRDTLQQPKHATRGFEGIHTKQEKP